MEPGPQIIDGISCYAPELAYSNENYGAEIFERLYNAEDRNFWFRSRNRLIRHLVKKIQRKTGAMDFLEIGCGTGYVLKGLSGLKDLRLQGSEIYLEGLRFAKKRIPGVQLIQMDATRMPFESSFDIIGAFDVLEHIDEDVLVMKQVNRSLLDGGYFLVSVPQHRFLWSYLDDMAYHKRRYTRKEMRAKLNEAGFETEFISSFVFFLFPFMYLSRLIKGRKKTGHDLDSQMKELELPSVVNKFFGWLMRMDEFLIRSGLSLPFGGSLVVVARKT